MSTFYFDHIFAYLKDIQSVLLSRLSYTNRERISLKVSDFSYIV